TSICFCYFFFSSRRLHTRSTRDWSSDVCSSDLFHHGERGRVGRGFGSSSFSEDSFYFGETPEHLVLRLQNLAGLRDRHARQGRGHVEQNTFVEWGHELRAQTEIHGDRDCHGEHRSRDGLPPVF